MDSVGGPQPERGPWTDQRPRGATGFQDLADLGPVARGGAVRSADRVVPRSGLLTAGALGGREFAAARRLGRPGVCGGPEFGAARQWACVTRREGDRCRRISAARSRVFSPSSRRSAVLALRRSTSVPGNRGDPTPDTATTRKPSRSAAEPEPASVTGRWEPVGSHLDAGPKKVSPRPARAGRLRLRRFPHGPREEPARAIGERARGAGRGQEAEGREVVGREVERQKVEIWVPSSGRGAVPRMAGPSPTGDTSCLSPSGHALRPATTLCLTPRRDAASAADAPVRAGRGGEQVHGEAWPGPSERPRKLLSAVPGCKVRKVTPGAQEPRCDLADGTRRAPRRRFT
ncbi:hypothetical protein GA0070620_4455 [Micromonospora krabiensis]|uniref:Uncharacterized protein n=1 Tax=Micromonospora krabiensis TaxID=307121 RepID=A0A1C3N8N8_9ACTN|nr:hypothetical protein GA0070620_4455 [Micromonospora krabiensis]